MAAAAAAGNAKLSLSLPLRTLALLLLLLTFFHSSASSSLPSRRRILAFHNTNSQIPNCAQLSSVSDCAAQKPHCRWCRSESLDDACFPAAEARRLPPQVFLCN